MTGKQIDKQVADQSSITIMHVREATVVNCLIMSSNLRAYQNCRLCITNKIQQTLSQDAGDKKSDR